MRRSPLTVTRATILCLGLSLTGVAALGCDKGGGGGGGTVDPEDKPDPRVAEAVAFVQEIDERLTALYSAAELAAWDRAGIDLLVGPPCVTPAAHHGRTHDWTLGGWHTMRWNLLDLPAGVVPVSSVRADETIRSHLQDALDTRAAEFEAHSEGLPLAAQIIARPFREDIVLAAMIAVEDAARDAGDFPITPVDPRS